MHLHLLLLICLCCTACAKNQQNISPIPKTTQKNSTTLARIAKKNGLYGASIKLYTEALTEHPDDPVLLFEQAETYALAGQCNRARRHFSDTEIAKNYPVRMAKSIGRCLITDDEVSQAIVELKKGLKSSSKDPQLLNLLGTAYSLSGQTKAAEEWFEKALVQSPDDMEILNNIAVLYIVTGDYDAAIKKLSRLVRRGHNTTKIRHNLALAYGLSGKTEKAQRLYGLDLSKEEIDQNLAWHKSLAKQKK